MIGKQHIAPPEKYPFDLTTTRTPGDATTFVVPTKDVNGLGKACGEFIAASKDQPFFLTLALGDPHPNGIEGVAWGAWTRERLHPGPL